MKKALLIVVSALSLAIANAQNCPSNATYTVNTATTVSGTYNLQNDKSIAVTNNSVLNATIENVFASGSTICITGGSTLNLSFRNLNTMQAGGTIYVDATSTLNLNGDNINNFCLTITNYGVVNQNNAISFANGATINNYGKYTATGMFMLNTGSVTLNNYSVFSLNGQTAFNSGTFEINNQANCTINFAQSVNQAHTTLTNYGTINYTGEANVQAGSTIYNGGYLYFNNEGENSMHFSGVSFTNKGVVTVKGKTLINSGSTLYNKCTWIEKKQFFTDGTVENDGKIYLDINSSSCVFKNQGSFTNGANAFVQGYDFYNVGGSITGGGNFYFTNFTQNQVGFSGTGSYINFYDASSNGSVFDQQNSTPTNTTKLYVTPYTSTAVPAICDATLMPMSIVSFTAMANQNKAVLTWSIVNEVEVGDYSIERSTNGIDFVSIAKVGAVNRTAYTYTFSDDLTKIAGSTKAYYRLKQESKNGEVYFTEIKPVSFSAQAINRMIIAPNPATIYIDITIAYSVSGAVTVRIYSQSGQLVATKNYTLAEGTNTIRINEISKLITGAYIVTVSGNNNLQTGKFIKVN